MIRLLNNIKLQYRASTCTEWCKITIRHLIACSHIIIYLCSKELNGEQQIYTARCVFKCRVVLVTSFLSNFEFSFLVPLRENLIGCHFQPLNN